MPGIRTCECAVCPKCRARERARETTRLRAYGQWQPWADPEPARQHARDLMASGMSLARIAEAADVYPGRLTKLIYGREGKQMGKIRREFSESLLAVHPNPRLTPAYRVSRRLGALCAIGYSQTYLARLLGMSQNRVWELLHIRNDAATQETLEKINTLYRELCMTPAPRTTRGEKIAATKAVKAAERNGWAPPLAYNDIDDPDEKPTGQRKPWHTGSRDSYDEAVVLRILAGDFNLHATIAERREVVRRWTGSLADLERATGWRADRYVTRDEGAA